MASTNSSEIAPETNLDREGEIEMDPVQPALAPDSAHMTAVASPYPNLLVPNLLLLGRPLPYLLDYPIPTENGEDVQTDVVVEDLGVAAAEAEIVVGDDGLDVPVAHRRLEGEVRCSPDLRLLLTPCPDPGPVPVQVRWERNQEAQKTIEVYYPLLLRYVAAEAAAEDRPYPWVDVQLEARVGIQALAQAETAYPSWADENANSDWKLLSMGSFVQRSKNCDWVYY